MKKTPKQGEAYSHTNCERVYLCSRSIWDFEISCGRTPQKKHNNDTMSTSTDTFMEKMKKAGRTLVDSGAKTMLKTDIVFLEREIKSRKQLFGVEVYELMGQLEVDTGMSTEEKEAKIRLAFDKARKDIAVIQAKIECKQEEMTILNQSKQNNVSTIPNTSYQQGSNHVITTSHPGDITDSEYGMTK
mmetsp:Transcript_30341/g.44048  ORF Transcript_30341/g.44048 Transcript_30341/m.44048 type:complete len:187 (-) Transcript_30341:417-977(-)